MNSSISNKHVLYSIKTAAWLLGVPQAKVSQAVRTGVLPSVRRGGRRLVPAYALVKLLGAPVDGSSSSSSGCGDPADSGVDGGEAR